MTITKARGASISAAKKFEAWTSIKSAPETEPDIDLASRLSKELGVAISQSNVKAWRQALGLKSVLASSRIDILRAENERLRAKLQAAGLSA